MKKVKRIYLTIAAAVILSTGVGGVFGSVAIPANTSALAANCGGANDRVLGFPRWYRGLVLMEGNSETGTLCGPDSSGHSAHVSTYIWTIAGNIAEIMLVAVSYLSVFYMVYGGILIASSAGSDRRAQGQKAVLQAGVGLIIGLSAIAIINTLFIAAGSGGQGFNPLQAGGDASQQVVSRMLNLMYWLAGVISVVVIIVSGIMYASSSGDSAKVAKAKTALLSAVIGLVVAIAAFAITGLIINTVGNA